MEKRLSSLEKKLGHTFKNKELLKQSIVHPSAMKKVSRHYEFERLEFLGDRVLGLVIAESIYKKYPNEREGIMAQHQSVLVSRSVCNDIGLAFGLDEFVFHNKKDSQSINTSLLANAVESVLGALFLDGGLTVCKKFIHKWWKNYIDNAQMKDSKTALQEWAQKYKNCVPEYTLIKRTGPDHSPIFTYKVSVGKEHVAKGKGPSRKQAEQDAAQILVDQLRLT